MNWFPLSVRFCFSNSGYKAWEIWPACQTLPKALDISSATAQVAPDLLKALAILSGTTLRRSAVDWKDLKPYWPHFSRWSTILLFTSFSNTLLTTERRLTGWQFLAVVFPQHSQIQRPPMRASNNQQNKTLSETNIEDFSQYIWKFKLIVLENHHWNTISTRRLWRIKLCYDLFNHLWGYRNIM